MQNEVARIDAQGVETLLYSRENMRTESILDAANDVDRDGDIVFAFAGSPPEPAKMSGTSSPVKSAHATSTFPSYPA